MNTETRGRREASPPRPLPAPAPATMTRGGLTQAELREIVREILG